MSAQAVSQAIQCVSRESRHLYKNKLILAPMVRIGTLPTRLLALRNGADLVYSEELIDIKLENCERIENKLLGTTDFCIGTSVVFRTCPEEKHAVVLQLGTADAQRALRTSQLVANDVAGIDINMGCPMHFSKSGGMGAALLSKPDTIKEILETLVNNINKPITCKIRILETIEKTIELAKMIEKTGVAALAIHGRFIQERPREPAHYDYIRAVAEAIDIPVIANGGSLDIKTYEQVHDFKTQTGCSSVMIARAAQWNPAIFHPSNFKLPYKEHVKEYLKIATTFDNRYHNSKFVVHQMLHNCEDKSLGEKVQRASTMKEMCELFGVGEFLDDFMTKMEAKKATEPSLKRVSDGEAESSEKRFKENVHFEVAEFRPKQWANKDTPKTILFNYAKSQKQEPATFELGPLRADKKFTSIVTYAGERYSTETLGRSKKVAEQQAALACLLALKIPVPGYVPEKSI